MVGYDPAQQTILVHDCGRAGVQAIPCPDLELAWNVHVAGLSRPNTLFLFELDEQVAEIDHIAREALRKKSAFMLHPPAGMLGIKVCAS